MNKQGFTLVEILTAVVIVAILVTMAMPLYEKTIERSRLAEARTIMNRLQAAKLKAMDDMEACGDTYSNSNNCPKLQHLNVAFAGGSGIEFETKDFKYSLLPSSCPNGISAERKDGDYAGTTFVYYGLRQDGGDAVFVCISGDCEEYGLDQKNPDCSAK